MFTRESIEVNSYEPYSTNQQESTKDTLQEIELPRTLTQVQIQSMDSFESDHVIPELSLKSLFDFHVNGIIYYSQYMNN